MKCYVIIPAAGKGIRFKSRVPKQFCKINNREILILALSKFEKIKNIACVIIASEKKYFGKIENLLVRNKFSKPFKLVKGGAERQDSVYNALKNCNCKNNDIILVHDAARPFVSLKLIKNLISEAVKYKAVVPVLSLSDTIKHVKGSSIICTISRENLRRAQTPQAFRYDLLSGAFKYAYENNIRGTDESSIVENYGFPVKIIEGDESNIKITQKTDLKNL